MAKLSPDLLHMNEKSRSQTKAGGRIKPTVSQPNSKSSEQAALTGGQAPASACLCCPAPQRHSPDPAVPKNIFTTYKSFTCLAKHYSATKLVGAQGNIPCGPQSVSALGNSGC